MPRGRKPTVADTPSTGYGDTAALVASDQAVPSQPGEQPFISPDEIPNLSDPSARPDEPVTTGLPFGPGAGPEAMGPQFSNDPTRQALQSMLLVSPNPDIMRLLDLMDLMGR
jgi:hypothetical protein